MTIKKYSIILTCLLISLLSVSCKKSGLSGTMQLNGVDYPAIFVKSGYYFDKASMSETLLESMLDKIESVEKPANMGKVEFPNFAEIELVNNPIQEIDETVISAELERERDTEVTYSPLKTKREAIMGDKVIIDFKGYVGGELLEGGSGEDYELVLGSGAFIPGFEEKVSGHQAGKRFSFDIQFPENYDPSLANKFAKFEIVIKSIEEAVTPEINDEFVKKHTKEGATTVEEYKNEVKKRIEVRNEFMNNQNLIYQLTDYLYENSKFEPSEEALAWQFSVMMAEYNRQAASSGMTFSSMVTSNGTNIYDAYEQIKSSTPQAVQTVMIFDELINKFPSKVSEKDIKEWFELLSTSMGYGNEISYEDYKSYMGYDNLKTLVEQEFALKKAIAKCKIVDHVDEE